MTRGGELLHEELLGLGSDGSPRHSTALLGEIERAVGGAGGWDAIGRIAVGLGPGSFVGIRIGLATAYGLAASTGLPVSGICTLDAIGRGLSRTALASAQMEREARGGSLAILDARRGEVFAALYSASDERLWEPFVSSPRDLADRAASLPQPPLAGGSGAVRFRDELASRGIEIPDDADPVHRVSARHICAFAEVPSGSSHESLEPIYLRPPDAQRWHEQHDSQRAE